MKRILNAAWKNIRRTPYQALGVVLVLMNTFFVGYLYSFVFFGSEQMLKFFETRPQVVAFFKASATDQQIAIVQDDIREKPYVQDVKLVTKEQALAAYKEDNKKDPLLSELVTADVFPASIEVSAKEASMLDKVQEDLNQHKDVIEDVVFQKDIVNTLIKWTQTIRAVGLVMIAILAATSFLVVSTIVSMKVSMKRQEVATMKLLGATPWYIRGPFIVEGVMYGVVSSFIAWGIVMVMLLYTTPWIIDFVGNIPLLPVPPIFLLAQIGIGTLIGTLLGVIASMLAIKRVIK